MIWANDYQSEGTFDNIGATVPTGVYGPALQTSIFLVLVGLAKWHPRHVLDWRGHGFVWLLIPDNK